VKRHFKKMRVSQNYAYKLGDRNFTSTHLKMGVKIGVLEMAMPANL
jgi:hypothetical protein